MILHREAGEHQTGVSSRPNASTSATFNSAEFIERVERKLGRITGGTSPTLGAGGNAGPSTPAGPAPELGEGRQLGAKSLPPAPQRALLDYLLGP